MAEHDSPVNEKETIVGKDTEFTTTVYRLLNQNQTGTNDHHMKVDGAEVKCNGTSSSKFKIWNTLSDDFAEIYILESEQHKGKVVAIENSQVVVKDSPVSKYTSLKLVKDEAPEILFKKVVKATGSSYSYFEHYSTKGILGFDGAGNAIDPSTVTAGSDESLFSIY